MTYDDSELDTGKLDAVKIIFRSGGATHFGSFLAGIPDEEM